MTELAFATIPELGAALRQRETTSVELTRQALERLDTLGRRLNAVVTLTEERALREAAGADAELAAGVDRGPLHGLPYGAKDLLAAQGYPTSWGAEPYREQVLPQDATAIRKLGEAGAVLVAKLALIELAGGMGFDEANAAFTGPTATPWNEAAWAGGSSSGSGAAVGAGLVPFALGSETGSSIITPAAYCGVTGLRPTYGRVSRAGAMALSWTLDKIGPLGRNAQDCGTVLNAIAGHDPADPSTSQRPYQYPPAAWRSDGFRFGVVPPSGSVQPEVRDNFEVALGVLGQIGTLEEVSLSDVPYDAVMYFFVQGEATAGFTELLTGGEVRKLTAPADRVNALAGLAIPAHVYLRAQRIRRHVCRLMDELTSRYDALLSPTTRNVAYPLAETFERTGNQFPVNRLANIAGLPGIALPNGFGERGLPTSLCLIGRAYEENRLIDVANAYQSRTDWHTRIPPLS